MAVIGNFYTPFKPNDHWTHLWSGPFTPEGHIFLRERQAARRTVKLGLTSRSSHSIYIYVQNWPCVVYSKVARSTARSQTHSLSMLCLIPLITVSALEMYITCSITNLCHEDSVENSRSSAGSLPETPTKGQIPMIPKFLVELTGKL
jgi:hypothetical protein